MSSARAQVYIFLLSLFSVGIFVPELAASLSTMSWRPEPGAFLPEPPDELARELAWRFLLHGLVRAGAGFRGAADPTLAALAACSYAIEAARFICEKAVHGTLSDPRIIWICMFLAVACAGLVRGGKAKTA